MTKTNFEDLVVRQRAVDLVPKVYQLLRPFPKAEMYALCDQIRHPAISAPANTAEGQARQYTKEFQTHLSMAKAATCYARSDAVSSALTLRRGGP